MCKINTLLLPEALYRGLIVRSELGHIFYPFDVTRRLDGVLIPSVGTMSPEYNWFLRFNHFKQIISDAINMSSSTEIATIIEDFHGDKLKLRDRILELNQLNNLPGFKNQHSLAA